MTKEAGFDVKIQATEFATSLNLADKGDFEAYVLAWSGRADPDGNIYSFVGCKQPLNYAGICQPEIDEQLNAARTAGTLAARQQAYEQVAQRTLKERPIVYLYHRNWLYAYNAKLSGIRSIPDGLLRVQGFGLRQLPLHIARHRLVVAEFDAVAAAAGGDRLQFVAVLTDFGERHLRLDDHVVAAQ
jgi:peptide/nickel transport system substrate-binding protein